MSEEEKKAIEHLNSFLNIPEFVWIKESELLMKNVKIVLNLIEKQQKELNNIKEIEKIHRKVNEILRVELEQEKEINKEIAIKNHKIKEESNAYGEEIIRLDNELNQEKEKNKDLEEKLKIAIAILTRGTYPEENEGDNDFDKQFIAVDKIKDMMKYREFELQQEYKEFEEDVEWRTYKKILGGE